MTDIRPPTTNSNLLESHKDEIQHATSPYAAEIAEAANLVKSGDWDLAAKICLPIWERKRYGEDGPYMLGDDPESPYRAGGEDQIPWEVPYILGTAHLQSGAFDRAEFYFEWLWRVIPLLPEGLYMLGRVATARGEDSKAAQIYRRLLTRNVAHADGHRELAETLLRLGQTQDAVVHLRHALAIQPDNLALAQRVEQVTEEFGDEIATRSISNATGHNEKLAVFVADLLRWREAKLASALRSLGWRVILLFRGPSPYHPLQYFDDYRFCKSAWEFVHYAREFDATVFHVFCSQNYDASTALILNGIGPVVVDCYDQFQGMFHDSYFETRPQYKEQVPLERFVLENADGVCCRNLMLQFAKPAYKISAPTLFYPEYCWNSKHPHRSVKLHEHDGELHVLYAGSVVLKTKDGEFTFESYHWLAEVLCQLNIHFHIYPTIDPAEFDEMLNEFTRMQREMHYFHYHEPVFGDEWLAELSHYDVGIAFSFPEAEELPEKMFTTAASKSMYASKITDYLDAGVVTLTNPGCLLEWLTKRYGIGACVDWKGVHDPKFWRSLSERVLSGEFDLTTARSNWSISQHTQRLANYYDSVLASSQRSV